MSAATRFATLVAMLLHSFFGCSLHHAYGCESHLDGVCQHDCDAASGTNHGDGSASNCCHSENHGIESNDSRGTLDASHTHLVPSCPACQSGPCDGSLPGCHSDLGCSFVPSNDVVFLCDTSVVEFISYELDRSVDQVRAVAWQQDCQQRPPSMDGPLYRCAFLCTWLI
ncbi:hypothetical protein K227x_29730 [Rubripirellula lacrimiformis]|uniref:Uncharacterized protein n=1 Tax=Rubripirellula lacrimiformis TaxID=1930273 RepID=A0A517NBU9_9BACT|nr:hypothetical protein [Rubripirellula lacrimiformis]QDT04581.1 hypothetical protein K227x_29730 [Rubripirellula lacrimiformis]